MVGEIARSTILIIAANNLARCTPRFTNANPLLLQDPSALLQLSCQKVIRILRSIKSIRTVSPHKGGKISVDLPSLLTLNIN